MLYKTTVTYSTGKNDLWGTTTAVHFTFIPSTPTSPSSLYLTNAVGSTVAVTPEEYLNEKIGNAYIRVVDIETEKA